MIVNGLYTVAFVALAGGVVWRAWAVDVRERAVVAAGAADGQADPDVLLGLAPLVPARTERRMEIQVREKCGECENGVVRSGPWEVFAGEEGADVRAAADQLRVEGKYGEAIDLELAWFRERGWTVPASNDYGERFPSGEEPCPECDGEGHTVRWVPIDELPLAVEVKRLRLGLSALDSHLLEMGERS